MKLNKEILLEYSIYDLRSFGREVGVSSPTSLKKDELIAEILHLIENEGVKSENKVKKGRPAKTLSNASSIWQNLELCEKVEIEYRMNDLYALRSSRYEYTSAELDESAVATDSREFSGIFMPIFDGNGIIIEDGFNLDFGKNIYMPKYLIYVNNFKRGDVVSGIASVISPDRAPIATKIYKKIVQPKTDENFENIVALYPKIPFKFSNKNTQIKLINLLAPLCLGQRAVIQCNQSINKYEFINNYLKSITNAQNILIFGCEMPENISLSTEGLANATELHATAKQMAYDYVMGFDLALSRAKNLAEDGKDVIITITDLNYLYNSYISVFGGDSAQKFKLAKETVLEVLKYAKYTATGSITIICVANENDELLKDLIQLFNMKIVLDNADKSVENINLQQTYSHSQNYCLTPGDKQKISKIKMLANEGKNQEIIDLIN